MPSSQSLSVSYHCFDFNSSLHVQCSVYSRQSRFKTDYFYSSSRVYDVNVNCSGLRFHHLKD